MARKMQQIVETSYGEVKVTNSEYADNVLECWIGDNFDEYIGEIDGSVFDNANILISKIEKELF